MTEVQHHLSLSLVAKSPMPSRSPSQNSNKSPIPPDEVATPPLLLNVASEMPASSSSSKRPKPSPSNFLESACPHLSNQLKGPLLENLWVALVNHRVDCNILCLECSVPHQCEAHSLWLDTASGELYCCLCQGYCFSLLTDSVRVHAHYERLRRGLESPPRALPSSLGLRGLLNLGNTCFMNSVLQALLHLPVLRDSLLSGQHRSSCAIAKQALCKAPTVPADGNAELYRRIWTRPWVVPKLPTPSGSPTSDKVPACFGCELEHVMSEMWCGAAPSTPILPDHLLQTLWQSSDALAGYLQQDAQEFFSFLVNQLHAHMCQRVELAGADSVVSPSQANKNGSLACNCVVHANLGGVLKSQLECCECGTVSQQYEPFFDLSLPLDSATSLSECLDAFIKAEKLLGDEKVACDSCRTRQNCVKQMSIHKLPRIFTVHMKRFESRQGQQKQDLRKTDTVVGFPLAGLDLQPYTAPCALHTKGGCSCGLYDLHALVQHSGQLGNLDSGHYVAFVRHGEWWFKFDDAFVYKVSEDEVRQRQAYLLMFSKRGGQY